jgi:hypothetical protein
MLNQLKGDLLQLSNPEKAKNLSRYFQTGKGQYGEGDVFLGIPVSIDRRPTVNAKRRFAVKWRHEIIKVKGKLQNRYRDLRTGRFIKKPN